MIRASGRGEKGRTRVHTESTEYQTAKHHFREALKKHFAGCAEMIVNYADVRKVHARKLSCESWVTNRKRTTENSRNDAAAKADTIRKSVVHCSEHSWRIQHDTHASTSNLDKLTKTIIPTQRASVSQAGGSSSQAQLQRLHQKKNMFSEREQGSWNLSASAEQHTNPEITPRNTVFSGTHLERFSQFFSVVV